MRLLTWGLLGPGKGIEWAIDAMAMLDDVRPRPAYLVAGATHPKVRARDGEAYREMLVRRSWRTGAARAVSFDDSYRDLPALTRLIGASDLVILPYDSDDQVTSGVLVDAVASGRPVIATAFPHAVELLGGGAGVVVPQRDAAAIADVVRGVVDHPEHLAADGRRVPAVGAGALLARGGAALRRVGRVAARRRRDQHVNAPEPSFRHLAAMSDAIGTFEHADHSTPRVEEGYCADDVARVLIATCREPFADGTIIELSRMSYRFLVDAQAEDGSIRNRRSVDGRWHGRHAVDDSWGRAMWAFGTAARRAPEDWMRDAATESFERGAHQRTHWPRSMAFAAIGAADVLVAHPGHRGARRLLAGAVDAVGRPGLDPAWMWPEARLSYANAVLAEVLIAAGSLLDRRDVLADGLRALRWLLDRETLDGHLSPTPAGGAGPHDRAPRFDQQAIEAATMADACVRALAVTGEQIWSDGIDRSVGWFLGANDVGVPVGDLERGAAYDGLHRDGVNRNEGAESTLALITTLQHARVMSPVG